MSEATTQTAEAQHSGDYEVPEWLSLDQDEEIEWMGEPVMISLVGTAVTGVILSFVLIGLLVLVGLPFQYLSIKNTDFVVTNKALYVKKGVMSTNIESVGLDKIQNTEFNQSFWGKQLDFGSIDVSTAGSSGAEITFGNIEDARDVRERITRLSNEYASSSSRSGSTGATGGVTGAVAGGDDRMDELIEELRATRKAMESVEAALRDGTDETVDTSGDADSKLEWESDEG